MTLLLFGSMSLLGILHGAEAGTLTFMIGGEAGAVQDASKFIEPMAGNIIPTGGATTGQAAKICRKPMLLMTLPQYPRARFWPTGWASTSRCSGTSPRCRPGTTGHGAPGIP